jgi:hypothetical protein
MNGLFLTSAEGAEVQRDSFESRVLSLDSNPRLETRDARPTTWQRGAEHEHPAKCRYGTEPADLAAL